jgi:hypothetical protein
MSELANAYQEIAQTLLGRGLGRNEIAGLIAGRVTPKEFKERCDSFITEQSSPQISDYERAYQSALASYTLTRPADS